MTRRGDTQARLALERAAELIGRQRDAIEAPGFNARVKREAERRVAHVDAMPDRIRLLVHEYDTAIVQAIWHAGVRDPRHYHHIVAAVRGVRRDGTRSTAPNHKHVADRARTNRMLRGLAPLAPPPARSIAGDFR